VVDKRQTEVVEVCCDEAEIFIASGGRVGPLWKLRENLGQCLALRDCQYPLADLGRHWLGRNPVGPGARFFEAT
jgi:hypothetical protein